MTNQITDRILALDLGSKAGWAWWNPVLQTVQHGTWQDKKSRFDGGGMRYLRFRHWLGEMHTLLGVDMVVYEEVRNHKGVDAAHVYGGLMAHLTAWCEEQSQAIPYQGVPVQTIKKHATGKGNASKDEVKASVAALGHAFKDDNEADALALLHYTLQELHSYPAGIVRQTWPRTVPRVRVRGR